MKQAEKYSYLGDLISDSGVSHSVLLTVNKRYGIALKSIYEINTIIEDSRSNVTGSFTTALKLWNFGVLPALLNSASTWFKMPAEADKKLSKLSDMFLRTVLRAGRGCPRGALYWFTGSLLPANRIIEMKLQLLSHICRLESSTLASVVLIEQQRLAYPAPRNCIRHNSTPSGNYVASEVPLF